MAASAIYQIDQSEWMRQARVYLETFLGSEVQTCSLSTLLNSVRNSGNYALWNAARGANFFEPRSADLPDPWHVGVLPHDDGRTIRDQNGITVRVCADSEEARRVVAIQNADYAR